MREPNSREDKCGFLNYLLSHGSSLGWFVGDACCMSQREKHGLDWWFCLGGLCWWFEGSGFGRTWMSPLYPMENL